MQSTTASNNDAIEHRQRETHTVHSLFKLAALALTPDQKIVLNKNYKSISLDVRICCTLLSKLIKSNDQSQFFNPLGDRRHMFGKLRISQLTYFNVTHTAVRFGHIDCLEMAHELGFPLHMTDDELDVDVPLSWDIKKTDFIDWKCGIPSKAAYYGNLTCLKYAHQQGIPWDVSTCTAAALGENFDCLKYAVENGCPINESEPINQAAEKGNLLFLKYLHEQGCPWSANTSEHAIWGRNLECLKYIHENGCPWSESTCTEAVNSGLFEFLKYVVENGCPLNEDAISQAATENLLFLKYLHKRGCPWSVETCAAAAGELECLKYLHANGCPWDASTCTIAIQYHEFDNLVFAVENGCPLDVPEPASEAAGEGNLLALKYLHEHGCPWSVKTFDSAASSGEMECLKYLHANGCPWDVSTCTNAVKNGHLSCLEFLIDNGCPFNTPQPVLQAASVGNLTILKYLHERGCPWVVETCTLAASEGDIEYLKHVRANGCPWDSMTLIKALKRLNEIYSKFMALYGCKRDDLFCIQAMREYTQPECIDYAWRNGCPWRNGTCSAGSGDGRMDCLLSEPDHNCKWDGEKFHGYAAVLRKTRLITSAHITSLLTNCFLRTAVVE